MTTITAIKRANREAGQYFFEPDTMRFFDSHVDDRVHGGRYFVTTEKPPHGARHYTVREAMPNGHIEDASEFGEFESAPEAHRWAKALARRGPDASALSEDALRVLAALPAENPWQRPDGSYPEDWHKLPRVLRRNGWGVYYDGFTYRLPDEQYDQRPGKAS